MDMTGNQKLAASTDELLEDNIVAAARLPHEYHNTDSMNSDAEPKEAPQRKFSNNKSIVISCVGGAVVAIIIYKLIVSYSGLI